MKTKAWTALRKGDIVDVVAPGYASKPEDVEGARKFLISWGLIPRIPKGLMAPHFLHANQDEERFRFLRDALLAKDSAAVWCLRGGYGSNRLLPLLAKVRKPSKTKLFVGISDITSLHLFLNQKWKWPTLHGPLLDRLGRGKIKPVHERELRRLVFGDDKSIEFTSLKPMNEAAKRAKKVVAPIVGGNLVTFQSTLGTPWQINADGKFLFIEELGERGYRIDRIFEHLDQAGVMKRCKGVIFGDFMGGDEDDGRNLIQPVMVRWARKLGIPVFSGLPAGHEEVQRPVPLGIAAKLQGGRTARLIVPSGGATR